ncbi:hypothetical protein GALMADRAFT_140627 [Galerina marginata CBS 339.88]|uniref:General stress protein FMN-binding split barrel domain-containing protein n=1 Tax=Galerina marginata (strain CBS 339.88) TaxID=685588 RepID=A0A067T7V6_GALM3|nr:hypothetical protein GALMADRAFT_140627 [Galerina marginata CBS 339.88]
MSTSTLDPFTPETLDDGITAQEKIDGLRDILRAIPTAMLTTRSANGHLHSRAMNPVVPDDELELSLAFIANHVSHKCGEIENDAHVNVNFMDPTTTDWASFSGKAKIIQDREKIKKHWSKGSNAWFGDLKDGVHRGDINDSRVAVIQVVPDEIQYWRAHKNVGHTFELGVDHKGKPAPPGIRLSKSRCLSKKYPVDATPLSPMLEENNALRLGGLAEGGQWIVDTTGRNSASTGIFSIPPEILSNILELGKNMTDVDPLYLEGGARPKAAFELVASHTCLLLRNIALATPRLWATVNINSRSSIEWVLECIRRSGGCWLDITIELAVEDCQLNEDWNSMMDLVITHSLRWRSLSAGCNYEPANRPTIARICDSEAPGLQHLSVEVDDMEHADADAFNMEVSVPQIFKLGTPKLKFVRLRGLGIHLFRPQLDAVVTLHLDHTRFIPLSYTTFRNIITCSSLLTNLSVHGDIIGNVPWPRQSNIIHLPKLHSLRICGEGNEIYSGLLLSIEAPLLESLTLKDLQEHDLDPLWDLMDATRYANLRRLIFSNFELSSSTYERISHTFREITSFSALYSTITESPFVVLLLKGTIQGQAGPFVPWPRLAVLTFTLDDEADDEELIQKVVEVRKRFGSPLTKILLRVDPEDLQEIPKTMHTVNDVVVEFFSKGEQWPSNRTYVDHDDIFF